LGAEVLEPWHILSRCSLQAASFFTVVIARPVPQNCGKAISSFELKYLGPWLSAFIGAILEGSLLIAMYKRIVLEMMQLLMDKSAARLMCFTVPGCIILLIRLKIPNPALIEW